MMRGLVSTTCAFEMSQKMAVMPADVHMNLSKHKKKCKLKNCHPLCFKVAQLCALLGGRSFINVVVSNPLRAWNVLPKLKSCILGVSLLLKINLQIVLTVVYQHENWGHWFTWFAGWFICEFTVREEIILGGCRCQWNSVSVLLVEDWHKAWKRGWGGCYLRLDGKVLQQVTDRHHFITQENVS